MRSIAVVALLTMLTGCVSANAQNSTAPSGLTALSALKPDVTRLGKTAPRRVLFVGNSYFYYNDSLHNHVHRIVAASGILERGDMTYKSATIGGAALRDHAIDHLLTPENLRVDAAFDVVIMQGVSSAALSKDSRNRFRIAATANAAKVRTAGGAPVLYMTPAYETPHRRAHPDMIDKVAKLYLETGNDLDALVIPVGLAFKEAYRRKPKIQLHKAYDGSHPSLLGTYLAAATTFASLYCVSPVGNSYTYFGAVSADDARFLQEVAQDTVAAFYGFERQRCLEL